MLCKAVGFVHDRETKGVSFSLGRLLSVNQPAQKDAIRTSMMGICGPDDWTHFRQLSKLVIPCSSYSSAMQLNYKGALMKALVPFWSFFRQHPLITTSHPVAILFCRSIPSPFQQILASCAHQWWRTAVSWVVSAGHDMPDANHGWIKPSWSIRRLPPTKKYQMTLISNFHELPKWFSTVWENYFWRDF